MLLPPQLQSQAVDTVFRGLSSLAPLTAEEILAVRELLHGILHVNVGSEISGNLAQTPQIALIHAGWACEQRDLANGGRQIFSVLLPGDFVEATTENCSITCLTPVQFAPAALGGAIAAKLSRLIDFSQKRRTARLFDHLTRLGGMNAYQRVCHLLLELHHRLSVLGLAEDQTFAMPMTQEAIGGALGLTTVHVNRTLQQLRADGLIRSVGGTVALRNRREMTRIADYSAPLCCEDSRGLSKQRREYDPYTDASQSAHSLA